VNQDDPGTAADRSALEYEAPPARRRPGRPARTDRNEIVEAALRLVAEKGLAGLTMNQVSRAVGLTEMGIYRHVAGRDELVELIVDAAVGKTLPDVIPIPDDADDVRDVLVDLGLRLVTGLSGYPGVSTHIGLHGPTGPVTLGVMGTTMRLLARAGVPVETIPSGTAFFTSVVNSTAAYREHVAAPGVTAWGATARERLANVDWAHDPDLAGITDHYTGDVDAYARFAITHAVDAVLADARRTR
jgi:AcrR family transcriptional regulator